MPRAQPRPQWSPPWSPGVYHRLPEIVWRELDPDEAKATDRALIGEFMTAAASHPRAGELRPLWLAALARADAKTPVGRELHAQVLSHIHG